MLSVKVKMKIMVIVPKIFKRRLKMITMMIVYNRNGFKFGVYDCTADNSILWILKLNGFCFSSQPAPKNSATVSSCVTTKSAIPPTHAQ